MRPGVLLSHGRRALPPRHRQSNSLICFGVFCCCFFLVKKKDALEILDIQHVCLDILGIPEIHNHASDVQACIHRLLHNPKQNVIAALYMTAAEQNQFKLLK